MHSSKTALSIRICCLMLRITKNINTHRCHSEQSEESKKVIKTLWQTYTNTGYI